MRRHTRRGFLGLVGRATAAVAAAPMAITALAQKAPQAAARANTTVSSANTVKLLAEAEDFIPRLWSQQALRAVEMNTIFAKSLAKAVDTKTAYLVDTGAFLKIPKIGGL